MSPAEFAKKMRLRATQLNRNVNDAVRRVALAIDSKVVQATPVDVGTARSNWLVSLNAPVTITREAYYPGEGGSTAAANTQAALDQAEKAIDARQPGQDIWICNNLPYIRKLNTGEHSGQAARNFIETAQMHAIEELRRAKFFE